MTKPRKGTGGEGGSAKGKGPPQPPPADVGVPLPPAAAAAVNGDDVQPPPPPATAAKGAAAPGAAKGATPKVPRAKKNAKAAETQGNNDRQTVSPAKKAGGKTAAATGQPQPRQPQSQQQQRAHHHHHPPGRTFVDKSFPPHYLPEQVRKGLDEGTLISGTIRINPRNYQDAFIANPNPAAADILIRSIRLRNRSLHGDEVCVDLLDKSEWLVMHDRVREYLEQRTQDPEDVTLQLAGCKIDEGKDEEEEEKGKKKEEEGQPQSRPKTDGAKKVEKERPKQQQQPTAPAEKSGVEAAAAPGDEAAAAPAAPEVAAVVAADVAVDVNGEARKPKKTRRGKRVSKKNQAEKDNKAGDASHDAAPAAVANGNATSGRSMPKFPGQAIRRQREQVPLVQYPRDAVLRHPQWEKFVQKTGRVVAILQEKHSRIAAGGLKLFPDKNPGYAQFSPTDSRVPRMKIARAECPESFFERSEDFQNMLFVAKIKKWDSGEIALGTLTRCLGDGADIENRTEAILLERQIDQSPFSASVGASLPTIPFTIPEEECRKRRDFRKDCVFTIDPMTARDLDDALSVTDLGNGKYKIGVHIADVSYFIRENTELDHAAQQRATSVYLIQKVIPMLPRVLCENLCSLNPDEDRLAFSVEWIMDEKGQIESEWFGRSVIKSCCKLAYEHAQSMIDFPKKDWQEGQLPPISEPWTFRDLSERVNILQKVAVQLRQKRADSGALRLDLPKLSFALDKETGSPQSYQLYEHRHSNKLIEEFMLLANMSVAKKITDSFPELAVLRRHPPPKENMMAPLVENLKKLGYDIDFTSSKTLSASLKTYETEGQDAHTRAKFHVLINMVSKAMDLAQYFCAGTIEKEEEYRHYALCVPLYTHFTSPIRRYPDVVVHRLLDAALKGVKKLDWSVRGLAAVAGNCNDKSLNAKRAGESSAELYLALFIKECGPIDVSGVVIEVKDHSVDVLIIQIATVKRVYFDPIRNFLVRDPRFFRTEGASELKVEWKPEGQDINNGKKKFVQHLRMFTQVDLTLEALAKPFEFGATLKRPSSFP